MNSLARDACLPRVLRHALTRRAALWMVVALGLLLRPAWAAGSAAESAAVLPPRLADTGLYQPGSVDRLRDDLLAFSPEYPLWSDGAHKRRWLRLAPGSFIDASDPDRWVFPPGTQLWKEFAVAGRRIETRYITRAANGDWHFATYVWTEDERDAVLSAARGVPALPVAQAPGGRYAVPSRSDCRVCHDSAPVPVLGASAVQLSAAPALRELVDRGWLRQLPAHLLAEPSRIAGRSPGESAALGYLHANCGHCHNDGGSGVPVSLVLAQRVDRPLAARDRVLASAVDVLGRYRPQGLPPDARLIAPGRPEQSLLALRMRSRQPQVQMPPLGTVVPDPEGLALIHRWITNDLSPAKEMHP